jgi:mannose-6-phosphate isomerase-like protein (cupin superfamily)
MPEGCVVSAATVPASPAAPGDTATERRTIGPEQGCTELEQRVVSFAPGRSAERASGEAEEVLYVLSGRGRVGEHAVEPETAVFVAPGERYAVENPGPEPLELVSVRLPHPPGAPTGPRGAVLRLDEQDTGQATADREFRLLADPASGCRGATQFVGYIPPGRAPDHFHLYDEVIYVLAGDGVMHLPEGDTPVGAGSCIHLPRRVVHSLENAGTGPLQVLGVFRPAGSPSEAYYPDGRPAMAGGGGVTP